MQSVSVLLLLCCSCFAYGQTIDTLTAQPQVILADSNVVDTIVPSQHFSKKERQKLFAYKNGKPNPQKSLLFSLALPGAGQVYNGDWWKAPIALGATVGVGAIYLNAQSQYARFRDAYRLSAQGLDHEFGNVPQSVLAQERDLNDRLRQNMLLATIGVYVLQAAEAFTSAHLSGFDVTDDLGMSVSPHYEQHLLGPQLGLGIVFSFR